MVLMPLALPLRGGLYHSPSVPAASGFQNVTTVVEAIGAFPDRARGTP